MSSTPPTTGFGLSDIPKAPEDLMFGLSAAYRSDRNPDKVDLGVGAYRDNDAKPWVLPSVKKAKQILGNTLELDHEYLPISGLASYVEASQRLVLGPQNKAIEQGRVASVQTISGTGALHLGSNLLAHFCPSTPSKVVYVSTPAYANHLPILRYAALETDTYPYYDWTTKSLNLDGMVEKLTAIPNGSIVLLHACAHNPTGTDPTEDHWRSIASVMKAKSHLPFFDLAYQGFASGDVDVDAWAMRHFAECGFDFILIAQSYAKNMGLYGERVGCLHIVTPSPDVATRVMSQLKRLQRVEISTPPAYGARVVNQILNDPRLFQEWLSDLQTMSGRIKDVRRALRERLEANDARSSCEHITRQNGMFTFSGLREHQVRKLRERYHVYTTPDGRFSMSGLNSGNLNYVAQAVGAVSHSNSLL